MRRLQRVQKDRCHGREHGAQGCAREVWDEDSSLDD